MARALGIVATVAVAVAFTPLEVGLAAALVALGTVVAEAASGAVLRSRAGRTDARAGSDIAPLFATLVLATSLSAGLFVARHELTALLGALEIERMLLLTAPLAIVGAGVRTLRRSRLGRRIDLGTIASGVLALGTVLAVAAFGKTVTAMLLGAGVALVAEGLFALRGARLVPSRAAWRGTWSTLHAALAALPASLAIATLRRLDVLVVFAAYGPEFAGLWCVARAIALEPGRAVLGLLPAWRPRAPVVSLSRAPDLVLVPWLAGAALLAPALVHDLVGPRWDTAAAFVRTLAPAGIALLVASALATHARCGGWIAMPSLWLSAVAALGGLCGADAFTGVVLSGASLAALARILRYTQRDSTGTAALAAAIAGVGVAALVSSCGLLGVVAFLQSRGRPAHELLVLAVATGVVLHAAATIGWSPFIRHARESRIPVSSRRLSS
ncbi:MAG: hypothetical protein HZB39_19410 [Planctomycetes bacterium]|nr:hypothetical protein [Planctomycetota bacterium]